MLRKMKCSLSIWVKNLWGEGVIHSVERISWKAIACPKPHSNLSAGKVSKPDLDSRDPTWEQTVWGPEARVGVDSPPGRLAISQVLRLLHLPLISVNISGTEG